MLNIAICDDRPIQRKLLNLLIHEYEEQNGVRFNLYEFDSGEEIIEKFEENKDFFDLFFLDNFMKKLTGLQTALRIRYDNTECHIVFVTASDKQMQHAFMAASPLEILFKPLQQEDINKILDEVLVGKVSETLLDDRARRLLRD
ncbi:response regulator [Desulfosporosinus fructosivorans]|uniref:Stage 0 sporulation protein A homolog n=1 Tax=Desulfosporosinus fructosivorans TaxID=2018669 RepID=A0A4Z0R351_9FIRM|nr:response regulator [Desulfosporosinus fructosivorans]TGE37210.1 response regulator [Desulfosporosinus fructosivorans]